MSMCFFRMLGYCSRIDQLVMNEVLPGIHGTNVLQKVWKKGNPGSSWKIWNWLNPHNINDGSWLLLGVNGSTCLYTHVFWRRRKSWIHICSYYNFWPRQGTSLTLSKHAYYEITSLINWWLLMRRWKRRTWQTKWKRRRGKKTRKEDEYIGRAGNNDVRDAWYCCCNVGAGCWGGRGFCFKSSLLRLVRRSHQPVASDGAHGLKDLVVLMALYVTKDISEKVVPDEVPVARAYTWQKTILWNYSGNGQLI